MMSKVSKHTVEAQMMIRRPVADVFNAFIDPEVTSKFWFTKSSGRLEEGGNVTWEWEMYGVSARVTVQKIIGNRLICTRWGDPATCVDYEFSDLGSGNTYVVIRNYGFAQEGDELINIIKDNTAGFTSVLDGLKAWLEHRIQLNLVADKFPQRLNSPSATINEWQSSRGN